MRCAPRKLWNEYKQIERMGNNLSLAAQIPESHIRIYKNILKIQSPQTRLQMLETILSGPEYVASIKQAGIYGPILSYIASIRRGNPSLLPGEKSQGQEIQRSSDNGRQESMFINRGTSGTTSHSGQMIYRSGDPGDHTKAITFFSQCLQILGLEEEVALNESALKIAYKKASMKAHPDKGGSEQAFDQVTRAYAYLGEILRRVRGGRNEMVNVTEESPARLAASREQTSEGWKMAEPVKLNPKNLNVNLFNKVFEETRLPDPDGDGYGDWLKNENSNNSGNSKFNGKFNRSVFNEAFENEIKSRNSSGGRSLAMRQPQALVMAPTMGIELGRERPEDFTGANLNGLKYTDLKKAYTEESTFSHQVSDVRVSNKSFDSAASERKAAPIPLSSSELESIQEGERFMAQRQSQQAVRISEEDRRISDHFAKMQRYVITNQ
jgi:curved DNA-binding protein CbpA